MDAHNRITKLFTKLFHLTKKVTKGQYKRLRYRTCRIKKTKMAKEKQETELETTINTDASVDEAVEQKGGKLVSETKQTLSAAHLIKGFENEQLKKNYLKFMLGTLLKLE